MTRAILLAAFTLAAPAATSQVTAPAPRSKTPSPPAVAALEEDARVWKERAALSASQLRSAEEGLKLAREKLRLTEEVFAKGRATAADRDADRATEARFLETVTRFRQAAAADDKRSRDAQLRVDFFDRRNGAGVVGTLAVDIAFPDAERYRVAVAARGLVEAATASLDRVPAADWDAARRLPHVRVTFPIPRRLGFVPVEDGAPVPIDDVLVPLPLTRAPGGFVLVRDGERVVRFTKYPHDACVRFQEALAAAVPAAR